MKFGLQLWSQATDWPAFRDSAVAAEAAGWDSVWTWDHMLAIFGPWEQPILEGWMALSGLAPLTHRVRLGLMVGANTFRNPALTAKMATTLDHLSGGRAVLGIGGAWFEREHEAYGIDFGSGFGERLDRLDEAVEVMRGMLDGRPVSARGEHYRSREVRNAPPPVQDRLPILIGGGGEKKTLRTVARFADAWNIGGSPDEVRRKDEVLRRWCDEVGRDESEIERTYQGGAIVLRASEAEARRAADEIGRANGGWKGPGIAGTSEQLIDRYAPYLDLGFRHIYIDFPAPFDRETLERVAREVRPALEGAAGRTGG